MDTPHQRMTGAAFRFLAICAESHSVSHQAAASWTALLLLDARGLDDGMLAFASNYASSICFDFGKRASGSSLSRQIYFEDELISSARSF